MVVVLLAGEVGGARERDGGAVTIAEALAVPPAPEHVRVYIDCPVELGVSTDSPESGCVPDHAPDAVHEVSFSEDHLRTIAAVVELVIKVAAPPIATDGRVEDTVVSDVGGGTSACASARGTEGRIYPVKNNKNTLMTENKDT